MRLAHASGDQLGILGPEVDYRVQPMVTGAAGAAPVTIGCTRWVTHRSATNDMNGTVPARTTSAIRPNGRRVRYQRSTEKTT